MADVSKMEARIRELEARRAEGESVPELDALYSQMDTATSKAYEESSKKLSGDYEGKSADKKAKPKMSLSYTQKIVKTPTKPKMNPSYTQTIETVTTPKSNAERRAERTNPMGDAYKKGGSVSSASKRADGIAQRGKTRGKIV